MVRMYETRMWVEDIKKAGIKKFTFDELKPFGLDCHTFLAKAKVAELIKNVGRIPKKNPITKTTSIVVQWEINI